MCQRCMYPRSPQPIRKTFTKSVPFSSASSYDREVSSEAAAAEAERRRLIEAYLPLVNRERQIVLHRFFLDRTQEEVAQSLGLSQAHVSRLLDDALAKMRRRLERDETWYQAQRSATLER